MFYRKILLLFLFTILCTKAFSAVFVVTSNADAGPGTLREALTKAAANGIAEKDYINFNLPDLSEAGRTITIKTQLPYISSNLVLDGTTQPGNSFGVSNAKVILQPQNTNAKFNALVCVDIDGFEIYGMYVRDFTGQPLVANIKAAVLYIETSSNIQVGAPGKGNVFSNDGFVEFTGYYSIKDGKSLPAYGVNNIKYYSNFLGVEPDSKTVRGKVLRGIDLAYCKGNIEIGGKDASQRNIFSNFYISISGFLTRKDRLFTSSFLIENNYFNYDINGNPIKLPNINAGELYAVLLNTSAGETYVYPYSFQILNNKIQYPYSFGVGRVAGPVIFQGNKIIYEPSSHDNTSLGYTGGIGFYSLDDIKIGGENVGEANSLYGGEIDLYSSKSVLLQHNSIYCVRDSRGIYYAGVPNGDSPMPLPVVEITKVTANSVSGTATPLSKVELFWDDECFYCEPLTYVTTVNADASGNWQYNGPIKGGVIASSEFNGFTSLFTKHAVYVGGKIVYSSCGNDGSITGTVFQNTGGYQWKNEQGKIIGTDPEIKNLKPGNYTLSALNGTCSKDYVFSILDATPKVNDSHKLSIPPSCGKDNGSVTGLFLDNYDVITIANEQQEYNVYTYKWIDLEGKVVSTYIDLLNVKAGTYHLEVTYKDQCTTLYGPVILNNTTGPNIDQTNAKTQSTNCGETTGAITNITITGTGSLKYSWKNSQQQEVGTSKDLTGQPGGLYTLEVTDDTQCGPVYSTQIEIPEVNGITLDESKTKPTSASCSMDNGTITGIAVTGNALYKWVDANGKIAGTSPDLTNAAPGDYVFTAYNNAGCSKTSQSYHIGLQQPTQFPVYQSTIVPACFAANNGSVNITADALVKSVRWVNGQGQSIADNVIRTGIAAGMYKLYLTDQNGCETFYKSYTVPEIPVFDVTGTGQVTNDNCGLKTGSISGPVITGGLPPYSYIWRNSEGVQIGSGNSLSGLGAGEYKLSIADTRCGNADIPYTVFDVAETVAAPSVANVQLCSAGNAVVKVNNPSANILYRLYADAGSAQPLQEQVGGTFKVTATTSTNFYVSQLTGTCESDRTAVSVSVGLSSINIANAFTPNNDGINDYWKIPGIENYPAALVQVFSRYGQKVFESKGYSHPFDGTLNGNNLPVGAYYYIINLSSNCSVLSGSLSIIR